MKAALKGLVLAGAFAPLLAGCVIYSNEAGEKITVRSGGDAATVAAEPLEAIRSVAFDGRGLSVRVDSNGCTETSTFEVAIQDGDPAELTLKRRSPDLCKALVADGAVISWTYQELGLDAGQAVRIRNPIRLPAAS